jgi:SAM-dependent methyltransferase
MIREKLSQSLVKRGIAGTIKSTGLYVRDIFRWYLDSSFDRRYNVDTSGKISLDKFKIFSKNVSEATWYEPVPTLSFRQLIRQLSINFEDYTFIDFGSGKGRALFLAAEYPFGRIVGVEFSSELHDKALENIRNYKNSRQRCFIIESFCMDAVDFDLPPVPSVLFFYSPFKAPVFVKIIDNLQKSLRTHPRSVYILFVGLIPESIDVLKNSNLNCREVKLGTDYIRWEIKRGLILDSGVSNT